MNMKRAYGFTLIELMVTIVVAMVLLSIAVPSFRIMMANNRATTQANTLYSALNYARSEAIGRHAVVMVCPKSTADLDSTTCGGSADWANGWQVFVDDNGNGVYNSADDEILKNWEPLPGAPTLTATQDYIGFNGDGSKKTATAGEITVKMSEADTAGDASRCVRISDIGMVRVHKITTSATCPVL
jgi:type IV fimbrial biogenesis protein FimT